MEDILPLSSSGRLPEPLLKPTLSSQRDDSAAAEAATAAAALAAAQLVDEVTAPYQALPVTPATLITHNYTAALPVLDVEELGKEVGVSPPPTRHRRLAPSSSLLDEARGPAGSLPRSSRMKAATQQAAAPAAAKCSREEPPASCPPAQEALAAPPPALSVPPLLEQLHGCPTSCVCLHASAPRAWQTGSGPRGRQRTRSEQ